MLILTRRVNEYIIIGDDINIYFLGLTMQHHCRFGIVAPDDLSIHRSEIYDKIKQNGKRFQGDDQFHLQELKR